MKKWIFLLLLFNKFCFSGEPPFSDLQRKPSLNPYLLLDENLDLRYHQEVRPILNSPKSNNIQKKNAHRKNYHTSQIDFSPTIRTTGHPTYFMHIPYYNFR